jgi:hypothetical protein
MSFDTRDALFQMFAGHGVNATRTNIDLLVQDSGLFAACEVVREWDYPAGRMVQLDIRVQSPKLGDKLMIESFAGFGLDEAEAAKEAFGKFTQASLHPILASLIDPDLGEEQVEWETWHMGAREWKVCIGPLIIQPGDAAEVDFGELLDELKAALLPTLNHRTHWLRTFFHRNGKEYFGSEALLDNEPWPEGQRIVESWNWPEGDYRARHFMILIPAQHSRARLIQ